MQKWSEQVNFCPTHLAVYKVFGDETLLLNMETNRVEILNRTGTYLWELICSGASRDEAENLIQQKFNVDSHQLSDQIDVMLDKLCERGLLAVDEKRPSFLKRPNSLQIGKSGMGSGWATSTELHELTMRFRDHHYIKLSGLVDPNLLDEIHSRIVKSRWELKVHENIGTEECLVDKAVMGAVNFLFNDHSFFEMLQTVTGCGKIGSFAGRIYRFLPGSDHHDSWHTDWGGSRLIALSLNLSKEPYQGGVLQICQAGTEGGAVEIPNQNFGDCLIFRLDPNLRHRVMPVVGSYPKIAFAGWFKSKPDHLSALKNYGLLVKDD